MRLLADYTMEELKELLSPLPAFRAKQIFKRVAAGSDFEEMTDLSLELRDTLKTEYIAVPVHIEREIKSTDGSVKLLYSLNDNNFIEGIYMPHSYGNTLCVSTQVGCRMNCGFCASGIGGLIRSLSAGEIYGQVTTAAKRFKNKDGQALSNVVLMGSGEPLDNYDSVTKFIRLVCDKGGFNLSQRGISLSTCGLAGNIKRLADDGFSVTLSLSLHATTDESRQAIMPIAKRYNLDEVMGAAKYYFEKTGRRVAIEYAMIHGVNMTVFDVKRLKEMTTGFSSHINLIMLNYVKEKDLKGCSKEQAERFLNKLKDAGLSATIRKSAGSDVAGPCGQLRNKYVKSTNSDTK